MTYCRSRRLLCLPAHHTTASATPSAADQVGQVHDWATGQGHGAHARGYLRLKQYNSMQFNAIQCNSMQFNAIQCNSMQFNSMQFNSIYYFYVYKSKFISVSSEWRFRQLGFRVRVSSIIIRQVLLLVGWSWEFIPIQTVENTYCNSFVFTSLYSSSRWTHSSQEHNNLKIETLRFLLVVDPLEPFLSHPSWIQKTR